MLFTPTLRSPARLAGLAMAALPVAASAASSKGVFSASSVVLLPFMLALAVGLHVLLGRGAKAVVASAMPLASGQPEVGGYERRVYGTAERGVMEVVGIVLMAGLVMWVGTVWSWGWITFLGVLVLLGAVALDLRRWERVTISAGFVWFQRGLGHKVHQVAIENIHDVSVSEEEAPGLFTLRHLNRNRVCRLSMRLTDKRVVALPKTDAQGDLEAVENTANLIRTRQQLAEDRQAVKRSGERGSKVAAEVAAQKPKSEKEMMRELRRLRLQAQAPMVLPPAVRHEVVKKARKA